MDQLYTKDQNEKTIIGILFILALLFVGTFYGASILYTSMGSSVSRMSLAVISRIFYWLCLFCALMYAVKIEKRSMLLQRDQRLSVLVFLLTLALIFIATFVSGMIVQLITILTGTYKISPRLLEMLKLFRENKFLLFLTAITAGVTEELLMRGYLQPRLQALFKSPHAAIIVTSLLFGFLHLGYGTIGNILGPIAIGLIYGYYYWQFKNIKVLIVSHILWDLIVIWIWMVKFH